VSPTTVKVTAVLNGEPNMLGWALAFLVIAIIAAILGFGGIAGASMGIAKILFFVFVVLFLLSMVAYLVTGRRPPVPPI
jgi:uncharacterized membrane protein YtjA (UPF0391 family)